LARARSLARRQIEAQYSLWAPDEFPAAARTRWSLDELEEHYAALVAKRDFKEKAAARRDGGGSGKAAPSEGKTQKQRAGVDSSEAARYRRMLKSGDDDDYV
jgi:hypothetical protein